MSNAGSRSSLLKVALAASVLLNIALGVMVVRGGKGGARSEDDATVDHLLLQVRCGKGDKAACEKVQRLDDDGCAAGQGAACTLVAIGYETGRQRPKDAAKAVEMYVMACELGDSAGCWYGGSRYASGRGVAKDPARAQALLTKACDGKQVNGCLDLGSLHDRAQPPRRDEAIAAWDRGCTLGYQT